MIVISDTTPINYLVLIGAQDILHTLFGTVFIPPAVFEELTRPKTSRAANTRTQAEASPWSRSGFMRSKDVG